MLGRAGDAAGDVQIAGKLLPGHTHIAVQRQILEGLRHGAGGTDGRAGGLGQRLYQFHVLFLPDALARGDHPLRLRDGRIHRDAHGEVVTILLQRRHKVGHLLGSIPLPEDGLFANAGDGRGFLGRRTALAAGALAQPAHQMRGDDHPLDLVGALVDGGDLGVAVGPFHLHALEEAAAAVDLQGIVGDLQRDVRGVHLRHGGLHAVRRVLLLQLRRGVDEEPGAAQLGGHIRQLEGDALLGRDGLAELDALLGIAQRVLKRALGDAQRLRGDADASAVQRGHGNLEALALLAQ